MTLVIIASFIGTLTGFQGAGVLLNLRKARMGTRTTTHDSTV